MPLVHEARESVESPKRSLPLEAWNVGRFFALLSLSPFDPIKELNPRLRSAFQMIFALYLSARSGLSVKVFLMVLTKGKSATTVRFNFSVDCTSNLPFRLVLNFAIASVFNFRNFAITLICLPDVGSMSLSNCAKTRAFVLVLETALMWPCFSKDSKSLLLTRVSSRMIAFALEIMDRHC